MMLTEDEIPEELIRDTRIFHFGTLSMTLEGVRAATKKAIDIAKEAGAIISFDPNLREPLWNSLDEAKEHGLDGLTEADFQEMLRFANAAASIITTRKGALRVMPTPSEIEQVI